MSRLGVARVSLLAVELSYYHRIIRICTNYVAYRSRESAIRGSIPTDGGAVMKRVRRVVTRINAHAVIVACCRPNEVIV